MKGKYTWEQLQVAPYGLVGPRLDVLVGRKVGTFRFDNEAIRSEIVDRCRGLGSLAWCEEGATPSFPRCNAAARKQPFGRAR